MLLSGSVVNVLIPETVSLPVVETFPAMLLVIVVEKLASFPKAFANSPNVFKVEGAEFTKLFIAV